MHIGSISPVSSTRLLNETAIFSFYDGAEKRVRMEEGEEETRRTVQSSIVMPAIETKSREAAISELKESEKKEVNIR